MYIDESRANIWMMTHEQQDLATMSFLGQRYNENNDYPNQPGTQKGYMQPNSQHYHGYPQPIIIGPNPLPPVLIGGWGSQQALPYQQYPQSKPQQEPQPDMAPTSPPPNFTPQKQATPGPGLKSIDPGGIKGCQYRFVYIWPMYGPGYWMYLTYVGNKSIAGFRWNGRRYVYGGVDLNAIESFQCY